MEFSKLVRKVRNQLATINRWENGHVIPSNLAQKSFFDFCENNFIDITSLKEEKHED